MPSSRVGQGTLESVGGPGVILSPDPTELTTKATDAAKEELRREHASQAALFEAKLAILSERIDSIMHGKVLLNDRVSRLPDEVKLATDNVKSTCSEQIISLELRLTQHITAVQKDQLLIAIEKGDTATTKQIEQVGQLVHTMRDGQDDKLNDLKSRVIMIEGRTAGISTSHQTQQWGVGIIITALIGGLGLLLGLIQFVGRLPR